MRKGDKLTWTDVNGKQHEGEIVKLVWATFLVKMADGKVMRVSKKYDE